MDFIKVDNKITLSPLTKEDFPIFIDRINDYEIYKNTCNIPHPYTLKHAEEALIHFNNRSVKFGKNTTWSIRENEEVIGGFGFQISDSNHKTGVGYWLAKEFWGKGIMTKVVLEMSKVGFEIYNFDRMQAHVFENNIASCKVLEKCNFVLEAKCIKNYYLKDGILQNAKLYAKTK